jgi:hypothetical protein
MLVCMVKKRMVRITLWPSAHLIHCGTLRDGGRGGRGAQPLLVEGVDALNLVGVRGLRKVHRLERRVASVQFALHVSQMQARQSQRRGGGQKKQVAIHENEITNKMCN